MDHNSRSAWRSENKDHVVGHPFEAIGFVWEDTGYRNLQLSSYATFNNRCIFYAASIHSCTSEGDRQGAGQPL